jgi:hypothetical protein
VLWHFIVIKGEGEGEGGTHTYTYRWDSIELRVSGETQTQIYGVYRWIENEAETHTYEEYILMMRTGHTI